METLQYSIGTLDLVEFRVSKAALLVSHSRVFTIFILVGSLRGSPSSSTKSWLALSG